MTEVCLDVIRVTGGREVRLVAAIAIGWRTGVTRRVAGSARGIDMLSGQRKRCVGMVETGWRPSAGGVTDSAILTKALGHMVGFGNRLKI